MCGFIGILGPSYKNLSNRISPALLRIRHRGPDADGFWLDDDRHYGVGHHRLSILDLSDDANQPFVFQDNILAYNGEIYNHNSLKKEYTPKFDFKTSCDTESLMALLHQYGTKSLSYLSGMFAGAFYQKNQHHLTLFRDSLGIKPLYYAFLPDKTLIFASEMRALLSLDVLQKDKDFETIHSYALFENWPQGSTFFKEIKLLKPGQILEAEFKNQEMKISFSQMMRHKSDYDNKLTYDEAVSFTRDKVSNSVERHLLSDAPVGCYLSGGIDSSLVAAIATSHKPDITSYTGYFSGVDSWYDESNLAEKFSNHLNIKNTKINITPTHFRDEFDKVILALEEPRMGMGSFSQYIVAKEASNHVKVILTGHGGDELFCGYPMFKALTMIEALPGINAFKHSLNLSQKDWVFALYVLSYWATGRKYPFAPKLYPSLAKKIHSKVSAEHFYAANYKIEALYQYYINHYIPGLLMVEDKISMCHSLETRMPLWTQDIVSSIQDIPLEYKLSNGKPKGLLIDAAKDYLPQWLMNAPKRGFPTPLKEWFRRDLYDDISDRLLTSNSYLHDFIHKKNIQKLIANHKKRPLPYGLDEKRAHQIWILLCLESWFRQFG